jgi:hypothetical protein
MARLARLARAARALPAEAAAASPLVRAALDPAAGGRRGRPLAAALADAAAGSAPWEAALAIVAWLSEAGGPVPEGFAAPEALAARWDALRAGWPGAPDLPRALARLPRHLEVGLRAQGAALACGLQLASAGDAPAVREALGAPAVADLAREALRLAGPALRCPACAREVFALHLLRLRGLGEVHALACPRCGELLRSYARYGAPEGVEGLAPLAVELGLVAEVHATLGGRPLVLALPAPRRAALTAGGLRRLAHALLFAAHAIPLEPAHLDVQVDGRTIAARARVPPGAVTLALRGGLDAAAAAARIAAAAARRFRG